MWNYFLATLYLWAATMFFLHGIWADLENTHRDEWVWASYVKVVKRFLARYESVLAADLLMLLTGSVMCLLALVVEMPWVTGLVDFYIVVAQATAAPMMIAVGLATVCVSACDFVNEVKNGWK